MIDVEAVKILEQALKQQAERLGLVSQAAEVINALLAERVEMEAVINGQRADISRERQDGSGAIISTVRAQRNDFRTQLAEMTLKYDNLSKLCSEHRDRTEQVKVLQEENRRLWVKIIAIRETAT